jgi:hypothetical protein
MNLLRHLLHRRFVDAAIPSTHPVGNASFVWDGQSGPLMHQSGYWLFASLRVLLERRG